MIADPIDSSIARRTFRLELQRSVSGGIIETFSVTFVIFVLDRVFQASDAAKATVISAIGTGLLGGFAVIAAIQHWRIPPSRMAAFIFAAGALAVLVAALATSLTVFVLSVSAAFFLWALTPPLVTQFYRSNYPSGTRGKIFAQISLLRAVVAIVFGLAAGRILEAWIGHYQWVLICIPLAFLWGAWLFWLIPTERQEVNLRRMKRRHLWAAFVWLREDRRFGIAIVSWMFVGIAMLMAGALMTEYVTNADYGRGYTALRVAVVTTVIPTVMQLATSYSWGLLFDRMPFFRLRLLLNAIAALSIVLYFTMPGFAGVCLGAALFGVIRGGGNVAWNLWVTKLAPEEHVGEYMSVHTFFTGLRRILTPWLGFFLLRHYGSGVFALVCFVMVAVSCVFLVPLLREEAESPGEFSET